MLNVGLTGGIGAGKSAVAARLRARGAVVIDSDVLAREVVAVGTCGLARVVDEFGDDVLDASGALDRVALAARVFGDDTARSTLEGIVHPLVRQRADDLSAAAPDDAIVVNDVPLLAEVGLAPTFDLVVVVEAPVQIRLDRLIGRGLAETQARARIAAQTSDETRRSVAGVVIDNSGTPAQLDAVIERLWHERLAPFEENKRLRRPVRPPEIPRPNEHPPNWDADYARVAARLRHVLADTAQRVDHVGATAVPGLVAEPVLDVQVTVASMPAADNVRQRLEAAGFPATDVTTDDPAADDNNPYPPAGGPAAGCRKRLHLGTDPAFGLRIHLRAAGSPGARSALLFRDWLRADTDARDEYGTLNRRQADVAASATKSGWPQDPLVTAMLPRAEQWARRTGWTDPGAGPG